MECPKKFLTEREKALCDYFELEGKMNLASYLSVDLDFDSLKSRQQDLKNKIMCNGCGAMPDLENLDSVILRNET